MQSPGIFNSTDWKILHGSIQIEPFIRYLWNKYGELYTL